MDLSARTPLSLPEIGMIAGTRGMLGAGIALLVSEKIPLERRRTLGWTLLSIGVLTTIPIALQLFGSQKKSLPEAH